MTLQEIMRKYLAWCPRFSVPSTQQIPLTEMPSLGKIGFIAMLAIWGLGSLYQGLRYLMVNIPQMSEMLSSPYAGIFLQEALVFPFGLSILILVIDYVVTGRIVRRHWLELLTTIIFGALIRVARPTMDVVIWFQGGLSWTRLTFWVSLPQNIVYALIADSYVVILLVLCSYILNRVLTKKSIISKGIFPLLVANYLWIGLDWVWISLIQPSLDSVTNPFFSQVWYVQASVYLEVVVNVVFALFLLNVYLGLRKADHFEVSAPIYLRSFFLFYGVFSVFYRVVSYSTYSTGTIGDYPWLTAAGIIGDLAIALVAIYPPRLIVVNNRTELET